jgi:hypothetical protein
MSVNIFPMKKFYAVSALLLTPAVVSAAEFAGIKGLIYAVGRIINQLTIIVGGIALLIFFFGLMKFIFKANDPKAHEEGKNIMVWGIIALFVMFAIHVRHLGDSQVYGKCTRGRGAYQTGLYWSSLYFRR